MKAPLVSTLEPISEKVVSSLCFLKFNWYRYTLEAFAWLVGPCEIVPRETDGELAAVKLRKCRYLEQCGCTASCVNFCKRPTEAGMKLFFCVHSHSTKPK